MDDSMGPAIAELAPNRSTVLLVRLLRMLECLLFVCVVLTAVFSISELAARDTILSLVNSRIASMKSDFVERTRAQIITSGAAGNAGEPPKEAVVAAEERSLQLKRILFIEDLRRNIQTLSALGAETRRTSLRAIQDELNEFAASPSAAASAVKLSSGGGFSSVLGSTMEPLLLLSSDQLLAIAVLACGAIGSMISSLRANNALSLRALVLGVASGFVAYLAIKGGKHLFLLQSQAELVAFNPYGSAFAGLLAGLFTERAHQVLSSVVDDLVARIRAASAIEPKRKA